MPHSLHASNHATRSPVQPARGPLRSLPAICSHLTIDQRATPRAWLGIRTALPASWRPLVKASYGRAHPGTDPRLRARCDRSRGRAPGAGEWQTDLDAHGTAIHCYHPPHCYHASRRTTDPGERANIPMRRPGCEMPACPDRLVPTASIGDDRRCAPSAENMGDGNHAESASKGSASLGMVSETMFDGQTDEAFCGHEDCAIHLRDMWSEVCSDSRGLCSRCRRICCLAHLTRHAESTQICSDCAKRNPGAH